MSDAVQLFACSSEGEPLLVERPVPEGARTVHQAANVLGEHGGVYTGFRSFRRTRFLGLEEHLDRTLRSMQLLGWPDPEGRLDRERTRRALRTIAEERTGDAVFRLDVLPPGASVPGTPHHRALLVAPLKPIPAPFLREGVAVELAPDLVRENPLVKSTSFIAARNPYPLGSQEHFEHLMLDAEGHLLEATSANVYLVVDGTIHTAGSGVLEGITRLFCLRLARESGIAVQEGPVPFALVERAQEAFLTSSSRGVVPIVRIAGHPVGTGRPGPVTRALSDALEAAIDREATPA